MISSNCLKGHRLAVAAPLAALLILAACARQAPSPKTVDQVLKCNKDLCKNLDWDHIRKHCPPNPCNRNDGGSIFFDFYCTNEGEAREFCEMLMEEDGCLGRSSGNNEVVYEVFFGFPVGEDGKRDCSFSNWGTVIYSTSRNLVKTQYPGRSSFVSDSEPAMSFAPSRQ